MRKEICHLLPKLVSDSLLHYVPGQVPPLPLVRNNLGRQSWYAWVCNAIIMGKCHLISATTEAVTSQDLEVTCAVCVYI